jgi:tRNA A-37 threonylcarbamoyl transferase component Bud32
VLGRCRIEEEIGRGRTSTVYRAHHQAIEADVAVKVLHPSIAEHPEILERFQTEARALARIDNENVLKIYDVGLEEGRHFIVMEILEGESILDLVQREGRLDSLDALRIVRQAAQGLRAAHAQGIIHRDVKPQNLVLLEDGTVKVVDFGLAVGDDSGAGRVGTPHYMAPEVCESGQARAESDIYGLGISLYHMLVGQPPYAGQEIPGIMRAHIKGNPLLPERRTPGLPKAIADLVRTLTKRDFLVRPDAAKVVDLLDEIGGKELRAKESLKLRGRRRRRRSGGRSPAALAAVGIGAAVVVVVLAVAMAGGGGKGGSGAANGSVEVGTGPAPVVDRTPGPTTPPPSLGLTPEQIREREATMAREKREGDARIALQEVERWIRENWRGQADPPAVIARYQAMEAAWKDTAASKEADQRAREIRARIRHPHPDKSWSDPDEIARILETWRAKQAEVESLIREHRYLDAKAALPEPMEDPTGQLAKDLAFWHGLVDRLVEFKSALGAEESRLPAGKRGLSTADGPVVLSEATEKELIVEHGGKKTLLPWTAVPAMDLYRVAQAAFEGKETRFHAALAAYAFAHRLRAPFFEAVLSVELASDGSSFSAQTNAWKARLEERLASAPPPGD